MSIKLKSIFQKKIDRDIKSVIKAGDNTENNIKQELEEFVATEEIKKHLDKFFEAYRKGIDGVTDKNGVWISGFFGSGKSHLLKILSYVLKNDSVDGRKVLTYFKGKGLRKSTIENMRAVEEVKADVILFNIAAKVDNLEHNDSVVKVFNGAFNEMRGLCGSKPWVADLEERLLQDGMYETFKSEYKKASGKLWIEGRENFHFEKDFIIEALKVATNISEASAREWCEKGEKEFSLNVETFALKVKNYCEHKGNNHRVVFLVDEIGQYMDNDLKLILNLQTVVEELASKCQGKAFVIVTAQEELSSFVDENNKDFSKILGRFATKISLSSVSANEVIKERLLKKNKKSVGYLKDYYEENQSNIKNLILFPKESGLEGYKDVDDFVEVYPFVNYEFSMFQGILNNLRLKGAVGKDISSGERSLLEAYQRAAIAFMGEHIGKIIPLYGFYEVVEDYLHLAIKEVMDQGEKNKEVSDFHLKVLKTIFLINHVEGLQSNSENIATLMIDDLKESNRRIQEKTKEALSLLLKVGFVEKCGEEYIFLTQEEQVINKEIEEIPIERKDINEKIGEIIFERIYKKGRYNYSPEYKFSFNKYVDNFIIGNRRSEIGVRIITSAFNIHGCNFDELKRMSQLEKEVVVDISQCISGVEAVEKLLKIHSYLRKKQGEMTYDCLEGLVSRKIKERDLINEEVEGIFREALKQSNIFVAEKLLDLGYKNGEDKINEGLKVLINTEYFKLHYINIFRKDLQELEGILTEDNNLHRDENSAGTLALEEVRTFVEGNFHRGNKVNLSDILLRFNKMPYGWKDIDIQGIVLELIKEKKIKVLIGEELIKGNIENIKYSIINKVSMNQLFSVPRTTIADKYIETLKLVGKELFHVAVDTTDSEGAMEEFKALSMEEIREINHMLYELNRCTTYPGKHTLDLGIDIFKEALTYKDEVKFYKEIYELQVDFKEYAEEVEEVKGFYFKGTKGKFNILESGEQRQIFNKAMEILKTYEEDEGFIDNEEVSEIMSRIKEILHMKRPYAFIQKLPQLIESFNDKKLPMVKEEVLRVEDYCNQCRGEVLDLVEDNTLKDEVVETYKKLNFKVKGENSFMKLAALEKLVERKTQAYKSQFNK